jgi:cell division protein FtsB
MARGLGAHAQSRAGAVEAGKVAELEAAQAAAQAALLAEMDLLRRQKAAAEEQARRLETQARPDSLFRRLRAVSLFRRLPRCQPIYALARC